MIIPYILFILGLLLIIKGGDYFVDSAVWMAKVTRLPEVIIGATIVSLATTFPETMVSAFSALQNQPSVAIGNAVGSVICNTGLILGLYNFIKPSKIGSRVYTAKGLLMISYILILWYLSKSMLIGNVASLILLFLLVIYIAFNLALAGYKRAQNKGEYISKTEIRKQLAPQISRFVAGIIFIIIGSNLLVKHGVTIATLWGVPPAVIGLTFIALGTSLPELVTAITSLRKGHAGISIGNILGANILNICMVLGISSQIRPLEVTRQSIYFDIPAALIICSILVLPSIVTKRIGRFQSAVLLAVYAAYVMLLFYINHPAL